MPRCHPLASSFLPPGKLRSSSCRPASEPDSLLLQPALEFAAAGDVETLQQVTPIQLERPDGVTRFYGCLEGGRVTRQALGVDADFAISSAGHYLLA
jgi:hypothetical protein